MEILKKATTFLSQLKLYLNNLVHFFTSVKNLVSVTMRDEANRLIRVVTDEYAITDSKLGQKASGVTLDAWARQVGALAVSLVDPLLMHCAVDLQSRSFYGQNQSDRREHQRCESFRMIRALTLTILPIV